MEQLSGKYLPYAQYETVNEPWFDTKPKQWILTKLKFTSAVTMGQSPNSDDCNDEGHGLPFLQGNAEFGTRTPKAKLFCDATKKVCHEGDILLSVRAPVGELNIANKEFGIGRGLCAVTPLSLVPSFAWWLLQASITQLRSVATGSTFQAVSAEQVSNLVCLYPTDSEQTKIAAFLDRETAKIDLLIEKQQRLIKLLEEKRQAVISHAVTKGLNPDAPMKDSGVEWLGEVPSTWQVSKVKHHARVKGRIGFRGYTVNDLVEEKTGALVLGASEIHANGQINLGKVQYISWDKYFESPEIMLEEGMIIVVQRGSVGKVALIPKCLGEATINPSLVVLKEIDINSEFLALSLMSHNIQSLVKLQTSSTAVPMISQEQIGNYWMLVPPMEEQYQIVDHIEYECGKIELALQKVQQLIALLKERRIALISAAITGKIDVRDQVPQDVEEVVAS